MSQFGGQAEFVKEEFKGVTDQGEVVSNEFFECTFSGCSFREVVFQNCRFHDCVFSNVIKARFSLPEAVSLLRSLDIVLIE